MTPLDLDLGHLVPLTADQLFLKVFSVRFETRPLGWRKYNHYRWFVRNQLDRPLAIATLRPQRPPLNPQGQGKVYGATWRTTGSPTFDTAWLYNLRLKNAVGWRKTDNQAGLGTSRPDFTTGQYGSVVQWLPLLPGEEREIHSEFVWGDEPFEMALFLIPYRIDELAGEAFLCSPAP